MSNNSRYQHQQLENIENFQYNNDMKSKEEIQELAKEIANLEMKLKNSSKDKNIKSYMRKIENIMGELSFEEGLELNDAVLELLGDLTF